MKTLLMFRNRSYYILEYYNLNEKNILKLDPELVEMTDCSIYFICKRDRLKVKTHFKELDADYNVECEVMKVEEEKDSVPIKVQFNFKEILQKYKVPYKQIEVRTDSPYNCIILYDKKTTGTIRIPTSALLSYANNQDLVKLYDLEICYIGQSNSNSQTIIDRLSKHEDVSKVYSEIQKNNPHQEIVVFLFQPEIVEKILFFGKLKNGFDASDIVGEKDMKATEAIVTRDDMINSVEAMLINYFKPYLNEKFKNNILKNNLKTVQFFRDAGFSGIGMEFNCSITKQRFFTLRVKSDNLFLFNYDLTSVRSDKPFIDL